MFLFIGTKESVKLPSPIGKLTQKSNNLDARVHFTHVHLSQMHYGFPKKKWCFYIYLQSNVLLEGVL